jgi:phosphate transport system protein
MREVFHEQLSRVGRDLSTMADLAAAALRGATVALLDGELNRADEVIRGNEAMGLLQADVEAHAMDLLACQAPVAGDLRMLVAGLRMSADLERMGGLTVHLAQISARRHPEQAIPADLSSTIAQMAAAAAELADGASHIIKGQDLETARTLGLRDDEIDRLHEDLLTALLTSAPGREARAAIDVTLAGRYYERFADHAVSIAHRLEFAVTGVDSSV